MRTPRRPAGLLRASLSFGSMTLLSRIAGFVRDWLQATTFGTGPAVSAFVVAYRIPNYLRRIFAEGSFASAFVPVLSELRERGDRAAIQDFLDHVAGALLAVVLVVTGVGWLAAPWIARGFLALASGEDAIPVALTAEMLRITFPYLVFISMTALAGGVLNSFRHFGLPAFTPVLHNLTLIAAIAFGAEWFALPEMVLAWGVSLAGLLQLGLLWPALGRLGLRPRLRLQASHPGVRRVFRLMLPTLFSSSVSQFNLLVGTIFASMLVAQAQAWLYYSDRLVELPLGLFGVAIGTVVLPHLSGRHAADDGAGYGASLDWGLRTVLLLGLPAAVGLGLLAEPICATLFQYDAFRVEDVRMTAAAVSAMCVGVPAFMLSKVLLAAFYARQDTRTPMRAAVATVAANIVLTVALVLPLWHAGVAAAHAGIALATALAGVFNAALLWRALSRSGRYVPQPGWTAYLLRLVSATSAMGAVVMAVRAEAGLWSAMPAAGRVLWLGIVVASGAVTFGAVLMLAGWRPRTLRSPG
ncbi:MAG: murein biosynthesis integral membrane protein MurJ [Chiayiivirga sp.]|jgi:putative peptidoglycan lipid II flippase|uniref:murein biosynthesis integral membrane protein MurJ n=1 Tax=Chiayiivirga sp. TaxID=2041042 RepID=UPI0025C72928|nr:murein biosynthesis integral membrane protein MurJ [Chiayiivirga sp.]MCI1710317.1 murein biosynthesis integral membrane protein MurJ [Chiayiivirga sp.]MCI1728903.1 murein biosynthesis integral membrane protein MurJ [Chiayiivirga sp.]